MTTSASVPRQFAGIAFKLPDTGMTDDQFYRFCQLNPDLRIERTPDKFIVIMPPTNSDTGNRNFSLLGELYVWNRQYHLGKGFDSSTGFKLPNGAERSPDAAWISNERWESLPLEMRRRFAPICPDFVAEIRSPDQNMMALKEKMEEYIAGGCQLGWLIDPQNRETWIYRAGITTQCIAFNETLSGGDLMPGFSLRMDTIWEKEE